MLYQDYINLHQIAELSFKEFKTSTYIKNRLKNLKCHLSLYKTGICAFFNFKKEETIAFRAEEDALPLKEKSSIDFKSKTNMHACGHDAHMSMLLNIGDYLNKLEDYKYNVLLIFQPGEEEIGGSLFMIPFLKQYKIKAIIGLHVFPYLKKGVIYSAFNNIFSSSVELDIKVKGTPTHVFNYKSKNDAFLKSIKLINKLKNDTKKKDMFLHVGYLKSGVKRNICPSKSIIKASLRSKDEIILKTYLTSLKNDKEYQYKYSEIIPSVKNTYTNKEEVFRMLNIKLLKKPLLLVDDFSYYSLHYPTLFFLLGTNGKYFLHSDKFKIDKVDLANGYNFFKKLLLYFSNH